MRELCIVGQRLPLLDSREKATGRILYGTDIVLPGMLQGRVLRSPLPHACILHIDTSRAERLLGVRAVVTGWDTPAIKYGLAGSPVEDEVLLPRDKVRYIGDEVAAVAAIDQDVAEEALDLIRVEYEELPVLFDPLEAMEPAAPRIHEQAERNIAHTIAYSRGNPEDGFAQAACLYEGRFVTSLVHQGYLEPNVAIAQWDLSGNLTLWAPLQAPMIARMTYAKALGITVDRIRIIQPPIGGAFGAKQVVKLPPIAALLARKAGRPVRLANSRREEFIASYPRIPMIFDIKIGASKQGKLLAKEMRVVADNGAYSNYTPAATLSAILRHDNLYRLHNVKAEGYVVYTNKMATGAFRGFGQPQSHFAFEQAIDELAHRLGMDPLDFRLKNASQAGDFTLHGWRLDSCGLSECLERAAELAHWREKRRGRRPGRGMGIACCLHVSGNRSLFPFHEDGSSAYLRIGEDGRVKVFTGEVDLGQGARTTFAQIAAEELGVAAEEVEVACVDTDVSPHGLGTWGDRATTLGGNAVRAAAADARRQLLALAAEEMEANVEDLVCRGGRVFVSGSPERAMAVAELSRRASYRGGGGLLEGRGSYIPKTVHMIDPDTKYGNISVAYPFAAQVAEVEVNTATGEVTVLNLVAAHDLGKAINPLAAEGQIEGALAQGLGYALMEEMVVQGGKVRNASFKRYDMPRAADMPPMSTALVESEDLHGPFGAKGLAEPALIPTAPAIANAIYDAVGVRIKELPITPERVLAALRERGGSQ